MKPGIAVTFKKQAYSVVSDLGGSVLIRPINRLRASEKDLVVLKTEIKELM